MNLPTIRLIMKRICVLLALIVASLPVPTAFATYGVDILPSNSMRSGSLSWGYSDNATCMNGYPNVGESTPNSITTSKYAIENQHNILSVNASVYTFSITVTANNSYDGTYQIKMLDTLGNETSTGQMNIPAGTSRVATLRFYPKNVLSPITLSLSGRSTLSVDGCNGPVFSSPSLIESAPPPRLSNTWMSSVNLWDLTPTSFSMTTYSQALQSCAVGYAYLIYLANPDGILYLHRTIKISPTQASNNNKYSFTEAKPRTTYYIKEIAYGDLVNCLDSELPGVWPNWRTPGPTTLATPNAPSLTNNSDNSINVSLGTGVTGATDYLFTLYESDSKTIVHSQLVSTGIVGGSIPIAAGLKYGATYFGSLVAKGNGFANESSARSPLTIITIPSDPASPFSDNQCELNPSRPNSITKIQAASGYCIARVETNTSISVPSGVSQMDVLVVGGGGGGVVSSAVSVVTGGGQLPPAVQLAFSGAAIDGYVQGATVNYQVKVNGVWTTVATTVTDAKGGYSFTGLDASYATGRVVIAGGGYDANTGQQVGEFISNASASEAGGYQAATPLTMILALSGLTEDEFKAQLGISEVADLGSFDPVEAMKTGNLKALGVPSGKRSRQYPDIPTFAESGLSDFDINSWVGLVAPAKTPRAIIERLNTELNALLSDPEVREKLNGMGITATPGSADKFGEEMKRDLARYGQVVKAANIKAE